MGRLKFENYKDDIIKRYVQDGEGLKTIAKVYNTDKGNIRAVLVKFGVEINKLNHEPYKFNEHYFDKIDTPEKAYILGFLYADGNVCSKYNRIKLSLQDTDFDILENIRKEMEVEKPLLFYDRNTKNPNHKNTYELVVYSKHMCKVLNELGCIDRKSLTLQFPKNIDDNLMQYMILGYFDGDGSIHIGNQNGYGAYASFTSSYDFCLGLQNYLKEKINLESKCVHAPTNELTGILRINKQNEVKKLCDYMYKDASLYMKRKYDKYYNKFYNDKKRKY